MMKINFISKEKSIELLRQKKILRYFFIMTVILILSILSVHFFLAKLNQQMHIKMAELTRKLHLYQEHHLANNAFDLFASIEKARVSQNKLKHLLNFLHCIGFYSVHLDQINYDNKHIVLSGRVKSAQEVEAFISRCNEAELSRYKIGKMNFSSIKQSDFIRFSLFLS